jgi:GNAT superfamily N-acetyltransferase
MTIIQPATTREQLEQIRTLMRAFIVWHRQRHVEDLQLIDDYFDAAEFETELATLPGKYAPPRGALLLATHNSEPAGCVALRELPGNACEMKRMFVYPELHGLGVGLALAQQVIERARQIGFQSMLLDTSIRQAEAQGLYRRLGFQVVPPYYELPEKLRNWLVFMELKL